MVVFKEMEEEMETMSRNELELSATHVTAPSHVAISSCHNHVEIKQQLPQ